MLIFMFRSKMLISLCSYLSMYYSRCVMQEAGPETSRKSLKNRMLDEKTEEKGHSQMQKSGALAIYELLSTLSS